MSRTFLFDGLPALIILPDMPFTLLMLMFAAFLCFMMHMGTRARALVRTDPATVGSGQLLVGTLSLLSLLVGFTFSLALHRHDQRMELLLEESNAIRALHRTFQQVPEADRSDLVAALQAYARGRLAFVQARAFAQKETAVRAGKDRERLDQLVVDALPRSGSNVIQGQMLSGATRVFDAGTHMEAISLAHVPLRVYVMLLLFSSGCAFTIGISIADRLPGLWLPAALWCTFVALALATIIDLDAPHAGAIRLDPAPLELALKRTMQGKATNGTG